MIHRITVHRAFLIIFAGLIWLCVGIMLLSLACSWLSTVAGPELYLLAGTGILVALLVHHFGFLKIVDKNLVRILQVSGKRSILSVFPIRSYLIILIMASLGFTLRHSTLPKKYLSIVYIGIGLALILSSIRYFRIFVREIREQDALAAGRRGS